LLRQSYKKSRKGSKKRSGDLWEREVTLVFSDVFKKEKGFMKAPSEGGQLGREVKATLKKGSEMLFLVLGVIP